MDKNRGQSVHYKKDVHRVIELKSISSQFLTQNFVFLLILAGQEGRILRIIPQHCKIENTPGGPVAHGVLPGVHPPEIFPEIGQHDLAVHLPMNPAAKVCIYAVQFRARVQIRDSAAAVSQANRSGTGLSVSGRGMSAVSRT